MGTDDDSPKAGARYASSPCMAHEVAPDYFDPLAVDPEQWRDVTRWRRAERARLRAARKALRAADRQKLALALAENIEAALKDLGVLDRGCILSAYWPIKAEPDLRPLMTRLHEAGVRVALPVVEQTEAPLVFRHWTPGQRMGRGVWNIPVPPGDAVTLTPDILLAPVLGWDGEGYRLGYGGGYFDRTLATLAKPRLAIGVGSEASRLATIFPQPHDIPMDLVVTEDGVRVRRKG